MSPASGWAPPRARKERDLPAPARWSAAGALALLEALWPASCALCGTAVGDLPRAGRPRPGLRWWDVAALCPDCEARLPAAPLVLRHDGASPPLLVGAGSVNHPALAELVGAWKYRGRRGLAAPLGRLAAAGAAAAVAAAGGADVLVPVPLHPRRRRERGFNQAEVLARAIGEELGLPVRPDLLRRRRATLQQARFGGDDPRRRRNVAGAFAARPPSGERARAALVDDLVTSGATLDAAAAALRAAGWNVAWSAAAGAAPAAPGAVLLTLPDGAPTIPAARSDGGCTTEGGR
ncbi:MAG: ComF family protein [bacterium]|nr:ComF family protein [bacterium]